MLQTERLILRSWKEEDLKPFAALNSDPRVMEFLLPTSRNESDALAQREQKRIEERGWGLWAVEVPGVADFIGFIGLNLILAEHNSLPPHLTPAYEVGWRLAFDHWGKGYATEGAKAALKYGFETLNLKEIVSMTTMQNKRSRAVMERIGMHRDPKDDFDHLKIAKDHPLCRHVLYRIR
ncbi:MAG: GNAT family N-acetyltransferase [Simkaniaceae bacterium]|nr:GNAT family N-acetyltransferase [Candidatus Sacchlamyda saccharinae]